MKRAFDILFSSVGLIIFFPLFCLIAILITVDSPGGVFFRGSRIGLHGKSFRIFKFRSMRPNSEGRGAWNVGDDDARITKIGHFLRKSKLDELPQLINVFWGDMSVVGPRPELQYYTDMYTEEEKAILDLKPGITDWASLVNIKQFQSFTESDDPDEYYLKNIRPVKLKLQLYYRYHHSFSGDLYCIFWTVYKVLTRSDKLPAEIQNILRNEQPEKV